MTALIRTMADPVTYRRLVYLLLGIPLGTLWFTALVTGWSVTVGLVVTPLVIPMLLVVAFMTRAFAAAEAAIARSLLGVDARAPALPAPSAGWRARLRAWFGPDFWRAQAYLWLRWFVGFPVAVVLLSVLVAALGAIVAPLWIPFVHGGYQLGFWRPHTFLQALALVPFGVIVLPLAVAAANPIGGAFQPLATGLLRGQAMAPLAAPSAAVDPGRAVARRRSLTVHAFVDSALVMLLVAIWAVTSLGYFWPIWVAMPLATVLGIHAWVVELAERPELVRRFRGSRGLASSTGIAAIVWLFTFAIWWVTMPGYFWPVWTLLGLGTFVAAYAGTVLLAAPRNAEMAQRIETLQSSRAGAVDLQDSELRRIERDLHDGAQARLVALGMSIGMAEQKLAEDPERAGELLAEARAGAEQALRELRDLARGIHPPVLTDRGLEAALQALANATPLHVSLSVDVPQRPPATVESAAYFVAAEALANAAKHARADWVDIRIARVGHRLEVEIRDDGVGGADPTGSGLVGLRRRVEALDGTMTVSSPTGGPTTVYAELPCA